MLWKESTQNLVLMKCLLDTCDIRAFVWTLEKLSQQPARKLCKMNRIQLATPLPVEAGPWLVLIRFDLLQTQIHFLCFYTKKNQTYQRPKETFAELLKGNLYYSTRYIFYSLSATIHYGIHPSHIWRDSRISKRRIRLAAVLIAKWGDGN